jgi:hypothetical protein
MFASKKLERPSLLRREPLMTGKAFSLIVIIAAFAMLSGAPNAYAQPQNREYEVKAAFLYNFAKFIEWPAKGLADTRDTIIISILGEDPFGGTLRTIEGKTIEGRQVVTKRFKSVRDLEFSHILFISPSEKERLGEIMKVLKDWSVLTVSEMAGFVEAGGTINFIIEGNKVRFEINAVNAERAGLRLSSRLLNVAKVVK